MAVKARILVVLLGGIVLILILLALQLLAPGDKIDQTGEGDAHIVFGVDYGMLIAPGACVTVRWQVDHIQAVHFNDQPTVGQGIEQVCTNDRTLPVLKIEFQDNTSQDYQVGVKFLVEQPSTWLLGSTAFLLLLVSLYVALSRPSSAVPQTAGRRTSRLILLFAGIGMVFSVVAVIALFMELGLRFYFGQFGTVDEQSAYILSRSQIDMLTSETIPLPFVEYGLSPDFPGHNQLGYRGDEITSPKPNGVYRIVTLGDSSTYGTYVTYDKSYPYNLQQVLRNDYGYKNVEVINAGVPKYSTWNMLIDLAMRIPELHPDLVIVYAGWIDLEAQELSPGCYSSPSPFLGLDPKRQQRVQPAELSPSSLYRFLGINFGWMQKPIPSEDSLIDSTSLCPPLVAAEMAQNLQTNKPVYFERNMREMASIADTLGIKLMFMSWAYNPNFLYLPVYWRPEIVHHNAITEQVAQESGALYFDYAAVAPTDKASWIDVSHLTTRGTLEQAQDIAKFLVDHSVITQK